MKPEKTKEENILIRWYDDGFPPIELHNHVPALMALIREVKELRKPDSGWNQYAWQNPSHFLPLEKERVIIVLKNGGREQFCTWNGRSEVFTNAGGTQFKPELIKFWLSLKALPPMPDVPNQRIIS